MTPKIECVSCHHQIDAEARLCPYCGSDPRTGERFDPKPLLEKHFPRRGEVTRTEELLEFFRERQSIVVTAVIAIVFLGLVGMHRFITARNAAQVSDVPAIPLTEIADLSNRASETEPAPIPDLEFQYSGSPQPFKTLHVEPGAVPPPVPPDLTARSAVLDKFIPRPRPPRPVPPPTTSTSDPSIAVYTTTPTSTQPGSTVPTPSLPSGLTQTSRETRPERDAEDRPGSAPDESAETDSSPPD